MTDKELAEIRALLDEIERLKAEKAALISACASAVDFDSAYDVRNHVRAAILIAKGPGKP